MFPIYDSIKRTSFPYVTLIIIIATFIVFYFQVTSPESFTLEYALVPAQVSIFNPITFIPFGTAIFLHGGYLHIITNLWFLWVFGDNVEAKIGKINFLALYLISGVLANVVQFLLLRESEIPMVGASGAIAGVLGAYYLFFPTSKITTLLFVFIFVTIVSIPAPLMLGYWFALQIVLGFISAPTAASTGGIAFFAHVTGFVVGFFAALTYRRLYKKQIFP